MKGIPLTWEGGREQGREGEREGHQFTGHSSLSHIIVRCMFGLHPGERQREGRGEREGRGGGREGRGGREGGTPNATSCGISTGPSSNYNYCYIPVPVETLTAAKRVL